MRATNIVGERRLSEPYYEQLIIPLVGLVYSRNVEIINLRAELARLKQERKVMAETTVVNVRTDEYDVYIGRANRRHGKEASPYANPFRMSGLVSRELSIRKFREWVEASTDNDARWIRAHVHELRGKRLGCWCFPADCHGRVLAEMAGGE